MASSQPRQESHKHGSIEKSGTHKGIVALFRGIRGISLRKTKKKVPRSQSSAINDNGDDEAGDSSRDIRQTSPAPSVDNRGSHVNSPTPSPPIQMVAAPFQGARNFNIAGNPHFGNVGQQTVNNVNHYGVLDVEIGLNNLKEFVSFNALHDSSAQDPERRCHPGTREVILKRISNWVGDPNLAERILWMHGPAGVGKSAIAQTISHLYSQEQVAATFFFFRSDPSRNDGNRLFPTLAWEIAISIPSTKMRIAQSMTERPDLPRKAIERQFDELIVSPLRNVASIAHPSLPVIIVDGLDECTDDKLQRRILKVIGNAVNDKRFPLRFLISSRPEAHIREAFDRFPDPILSIDLAEVDDAHRDVEKYLTEEFARIALEHHIDGASWPDQSVIENFVFKSSGNFVYASTIIRFVGDEYNSATSQLDIVLGLKPNNGKSPYAELDALYMEILQRQPDQTFLKGFLSLIVSGCEPSDYALLLNVDREGLRRKLRGMLSLVKFDPKITPHHRSLIDFLQDLSRSSEYFISERSGAKRYLELISDALVRIVKKAMQEPDCHKAKFFTPAFTQSVSKYPCSIILPLCDWENILPPLLSLYDELLKSPWFTRGWKRNRCNAVYVIDNLLVHLAFCQGNTYHVTPLFQPQVQVQTEFVHDSSIFQIGKEESVAQLDLDTCLSSLILTIQNGSSRSGVMVHLLDALLRFDHRDVALKIQSVADAQILMDVIFSLVRNGCLPNRLEDVYLLAFEVYARVPIIPKALFLKAGEVTVDDNDRDHGEYQNEQVRIWTYSGYAISHICQNVLVWGILSHNDIVPMLGICEKGEGFLMVIAKAPRLTLLEWRRKFKPSIQAIELRVLQVAKVIQYLHSLGIVFDFSFTTGGVFLDSDFNAKVPCSVLPLRYANEATTDDLRLCLLPSQSYTYANDIRQFGCLYFEVLFDSEVETYPKLHPYSEITLNPPSRTNIHDKAWALIQRCCSKDPPTMDDVVRAMESWV